MVVIGLVGVSAMAANATATTSPSVTVDASKCYSITVDAKDFPAIQQAKAAVPANPGQPYIAPTEGSPAVPAVPTTYVQEWEFVQKETGKVKWMPFDWNGADHPGGNSGNGEDTSGGNGEGWSRTGQHHDSSTILKLGTDAIPAVPANPGQPYVAPTPGSPAIPAEADTIKVTIGGEVVKDATFGTSFHEEFAVSGDVAHAYSVVATSWQNPSHPITKSGTTTACTTPVKVKSTGAYLYKKLDASKPASWENSGKQTLVKTWDGWSWPTRYPGILPAEVCGTGWALQVDEINGPQSLFPPIVERVTNTGVLGSPILVAARHYDLSAVMAVPACAPPVITIPVPESSHQVCTAGNLTGENTITVTEKEGLIASLKINDAQPFDIQPSDYVNGVYVVHVGDNYGDYHLSYRRADGQPFSGKTQTTWDYSFGSLACLPAKPAPIVVTTHVTTTNCAVKTATTKTTESSTGWLQGPTSWTKGPTVTITLFTTRPATAEEMSTCVPTAPIITTTGTTPSGSGTTTTLTHASVEKPLPVTVLAHTGSYVPWYLGGLAALAVLLGGGILFVIRRRKVA